jgi:thioredoxin-like negative regulator of GroEL
MKVYKFSASWCQPCKQLSALLETIQTNAEIVEVDIDENSDKARMFQVRGVPTMVVVDENEKELRRVVGIQPKAKLEEWLNG